MRLRRSGIGSVRVRILASMLVVAAAGLALAGGVSYLLQRERVQTLVDQRLDVQVENLRAIAEGPPGGAPPTTVSDLLRTAIQRIVPGPTESTLAMIDGEPAFYPATQLPYRIDEHPDLLDRLRDEADPDAVVRGTARTDELLLRYVIVPVTVADDDRAGLYIGTVDLGAEFDVLGDSFRGFVWIAAGSLLTLAVAGWLVAGRLLRPLRQLQATAAHATESDLSERVPVVGNDDVSELASTVNGMLDRLQSAFAGQRRLVDDVAHQLRTPITILRGHLELLDSASPEEVAATRELLIDELDRMSLLVEDVVLLARADQPDFVRTEPVDLADLTERVRTKAAGLSSEHDWVDGGSGDAVISADPNRLTEAWLQLAENAVRYAPPGTPIRIGSGASGAPGLPVAASDRVRLWVEDRGPGVPAEDRERMFDRFARAQTGRGDDGSGLGLSIVAAIAAAHGGSARLEDAAGGGTRAVIEVPRRAPTDDEVEEVVPHAAHPAG